MNQSKQEATLRDLLEECQREQQRSWTEKARLALRVKVENGGVTGQAPLGYINRRRGGRTWVEIDEGTAPLVYRLFELASTGRYTCHGLAAKITNEGLRSKRGNPLSAAGVKAIIANRYYLGECSYMGESRQGDHAPIVNDELFAAANAGIGSHAGDRWGSKPKPTG